MSDEQRDGYYKIPSTPLKEGTNSLIFTRSQCLGNNQCSANCLVHKKRKRKTKVQLNNSLNSAETNYMERDSPMTDQFEITNSSTSTIKKMPPKRKAISTKYSNYSQMSDEDESEIIQRTNVNRLNYYENFSNDFNNAATLNNQTFTRQSTFSFLIGMLIIFTMSIYFYSTSQMQKNSIFNFDTIDINDTFFKNKEQLDKIADQLEMQTNLRAIESIQNKLQQSLINMNERIIELENTLNIHLSSQKQLNKELVESSSKSNEKFFEADKTLAELSKYKVEIEKFISNFLLVEHSGLKLKFDELRQLIKQLIKEAIDKYDADKTGIVDYASEYAGGEIISTGCTENYDLKGASYKILGVPVWSPPNIPRFVIQPNSSPGQCWYFRGNKGSLVLKLARRILPSNFSYEHISVRNSPDGHINSAPKHFEVRALDGPEANSNWLLGEFDYDRYGDPIQFFKFQNDDKPVEYIEFNVLDNHGNEDFTCLYRLRVHGIKIEKED